MLHDLSGLDSARLMRSAIEAFRMPLPDTASALDLPALQISSYLDGASLPPADMLLRICRIGSGLAQARAEKVPSILDAAVSLRAALAVPVGQQSPREERRRAVRAIRLLLEARDRARDTLSNRPHLTAAWEPRPDLGDLAWNTLFAAVVRNEFRDSGRAEPWWCSALGAPLDEPWFPATGLGGVQAARSTAPAWLSSLNIFIAERDLVTF